MTKIWQGFVSQVGVWASDAWWARCYSYTYLKHILKDNPIYSNSFINGQYLNEHDMRAILHFSIKCTNQIHRPDKKSCKYKFPHQSPFKHDVWALLYFLIKKRHWWSLPACTDWLSWVGECCKWRGGWGRSGRGRPAWSDVWSGVALKQVGAPLSWATPTQHLPVPHQIIIFPNSFILNREITVVSKYPAN